MAVQGDNTDPNGWLAHEEPWAGDTAFHLGRWTTGQTSYKPIRFPTDQVRPPQRPRRFS